MDKKRCTRCGELKSIDNFWSRGGKLKHLYRSQCKECESNTHMVFCKTHPDYWKEWFKKNVDKSRAASRRFYNRTKSSDSYKAYKERNNEESKKSYLKYPEKYKSRRILNRAVLSGQVKREPCVVCNNPKSEGHHKDYNKPFDVLWLCRRHHTDLHLGELEVAL